MYVLLYPSTSTYSSSEISQNLRGVIFLVIRIVLGEIIVKRWFGKQQSSLYLFRSWLQSRPGRFRNRPERRRRRDRRRRQSLTKNESSSLAERKKKPQQLVGRCLVKFRDFFF